MSKYIYSTISADQKYTFYDTTKNDMPTPRGHVFVAGKANIANKQLITPKGVVTKVSDDQYKWLQACDMFQRHVKRGYIKVEDKLHDAGKVASDMEARDASAPLTDGDMEAKGKDAGKTTKTTDQTETFQGQVSDGLVTDTEGNDQTPPGEAPGSDYSDETETWPKKTDDGYVDCKGTVFDAEKHNAKDGVPTVTAGGKFQKKKGD